MKHIVLVLFVMGLSLSSQAINCTGYFEGNDENGSFTKLSQELNLEFRKAGVEQYIADIGNYHFFVKGYEDTNRFLLMITLGPDYTRGVTASATWDQNNAMRIARVDGANVYKLICKK